MQSRPTCGQSSGASGAAPEDEAGHAATPADPGAAQMRLCPLLRRPVTKHVRQKEKSDPLCPFRRDPNAATRRLNSTYSAPNPERQESGMWVVVILRMAFPSTSLLFPRKREGRPKESPCLAKGAAAGIWN